MHISTKTPTKPGTDRAGAAAPSTVIRDTKYSSAATTPASSIRRQTIFIASISSVIDADHPGAVDPERQRNRNRTSVDRAHVAPVTEPSGVGDEPDPSLDRRTICKRYLSELA
jgi:hypothetical protein